MAPRFGHFICLTFILAATFPAGSGTRPTAFAASPQAGRNDRADLTFSTTPMRDGTIQVDAQGGDLVLRKKIGPDGSFSLVLQTPRDRLSLSFQEHTITVTRGRNTVSLTPASTSDDDLDRVHRLLADSRAARLLRMAAAELQASEDDSAESSAVVMADAVIGMLSGDAGAPLRVGRHLSRRVRATVRPAGMQTDCYGTWERRVYFAYMDLESCERSFSVWNPTRYLCAARYILMAESYWFSMISCTGFQP
jgi:hypothetical protein